MLYYCLHAVSVYVLSIFSRASQNIAAITFTSLTIPSQLTPPHEAVHNNRHLAEFRLPPVGGHANDYTGPYLRQVHSTSKPYTRQAAITKLKELDPSKYSDIETNPTHMIEALQAYITANDANFKSNPTNIDLLSKFSHQYKADDHASHAGHHHRHKQWIQSIEGRHLEDVFDIVFVPECDVDNHPHATSLKEFLDHWHILLKNIHVIMVQSGECDLDKLQSQIPSWLDYDLFTHADVLRAYSSEYQWLFNMTAANSLASVYSVGLLIADRDFVYFLDRDTLPAHDSDGQVINPLEEHFVNLIVPSTPYLYNTLYDAYKLGADFSDGYPYSLRGGIPTGISLGHVVVTDDTSSQISSKPMDHPVISIPNELLYSLSLRNLAINRVAAGPTLFLSSAFDAQLPIGDKYLAILAGWIGKKALDHVYMGVKHGGKTHVRHIVRNVTYTEAVKALTNDLVWETISERVVRAITDTVVHEKTHDSSISAMFELAQGVIRMGSSIHPSLTTLGKSIEGYLTLWGKINCFNPSFFIVASRSSKAPSPQAKHQCAVFTIFYNEPFFLPVWLRYYSRHFPDAVYLFYHNRNESEPQPVIPATPGSKLFFQNLNGKANGFSVTWVAGLVSTFQMRFLRSGYKCVLFTDIDEIVIPNTDVYPNGLSDYLVSFQNNTELMHTRVVGYEVCHLSDSVDGKSAPFENPLQWNESITHQRHFWVRKARYDKPLLSKTLIRYKAGQHTAFIPSFISQDQNLYMLHLPFVDKDYCLIREKIKYESVLTSPDEDKAKGFSIHTFEYPHLVQTGKICALSKAYYVKEKDTAFTSTGIQTEKIPEYIRRMEL